PQAATGRTRKARSGGGGTACSNRLESRSQSVMPVTTPRTRAGVVVIVAVVAVVLADRIPQHAGRGGTGCGGTRVNGLDRAAVGIVSGRAGRRDHSDGAGEENRGSDIHRGFLVKFIANQATSVPDA